MESIINSFAFVENAKSENAVIYSTEKEVKERLEQIFRDGCTFSFNNVSRTGYEKMMGIAYDFRPFLKRILVKQYGIWVNILLQIKLNLENVCTVVLMKWFIWISRFGDLKQILKPKAWEHLNFSALGVQTI